MLWRPAAGAEPETLTRRRSPPSYVAQNQVVWHNIHMSIEWARSAGKHDIPQADALFAMQNAIYTSTRVKINDGDSRNQRRVFVGPQHTQTDRLIEVLVELKSGGAFVIYHVMPLGSYYRQQMEEEQ